MNLKSMKGLTILFLWTWMLTFIGCPGDEDNVIQEKQKKEVAKKLVSKDKAKTKKTKSKKSKSDAGSVVDLKLKSEAGSILDKLEKSDGKSLVDGRARSVSGSVKPPLVFVQVTDPYVEEMEGEGTAEDPYQIAHPNHLATEVRKKLNAHYQLVKNLDLSGISNFEPIGVDWKKPFNGKFDGGGNTIKGLTIDRENETNVGLFGATGTSSVIENVKLIEVNVKGGSSVGALAGITQNLVKNIQASGSVSGKNSVGGLIGYMEKNLTGSRADVVVTGLEAGKPESCDPFDITHSDKPTEGLSYGVGGLVGYHKDEQIVKSEATGNVTGYYCGVGGLVGISRGEIIESRASGNVEGKDENVGALVGLEDDGKIDDKSEGTGRVTKE